MKPQELRIGNYLQDRKGIICMVDKIEVEEFKAHSVFGAVTHLPVQPIPLTEEWLEKFGFEKRFEEEVNMFYSRELRVKITYTYPFGFYETRYDVNIEYVHQLQNLYFALTGQELCVTQL